MLNEPLPYKPRRRSPPLTRQRETSEQQQPTRILVAVGDSKLRQSIVEALREDGHDVVQARNRGALVDRVRNGSDVELVLCSVAFPEGSSLDALDELQRHLWSTPIVLVATDSDDEVVAEARRLNVAHVVSGPELLAELQSAVRSLVATQP